ncbi:MAG: AAA family ATPase, partial [Acidimicrobiales bacterium]|nr:AAA family ATPase [Acidimicrobiales bacterium]
MRRLEGRFSVPLTIVTGGGGAGKTTVLGQAAVTGDERTDVWIAATESDDPDRLCRRMMAAVGQPDPAGTVGVEAVADALLARAPQQVCVMVDDAHRLPSLEALEALVAVMPRNGHLLVGSRRRPELGLSRLDAAGRLLQIDQDELLMDDAEVVAVARARGVDRSQIEPAGGWPALVELLSRHGSGIDPAMVVDEVLGDLEPERADAMAAFAFVGGGDDEMARAVAGMPLAALVDGLPLVAGDGRRSARPHDLWFETIGDRLDAAARTAAAVAGAAVLRDRGDLDGAIELVARVDHPSTFRSLVRTACLEAVDRGRHLDRLGRWLKLAPSAVAP